MKKKKSISSTIKSEVLEALQKPGSVLTNIAKSYGISRGNIYHWIGPSRSSLIKSLGDKTSHKQPRFVELAVAKPIAPKLQRASLIFENYSLSIEGNIKLQNLIQIINILESSC